MTMASEELNNECTDICTKFAKLAHRNGKLPTHDELVSCFAVKQEEYKEDELQEGILLGTLQELRQRKSCPVCRLVLIAIDDAADGVSQPPADQPVRLLLFPGEQSFRLSYPSRLGTRLAFLADNDSQISGPDSARVVKGDQINPAKVLLWLRKCEEHHGPTCYPQINGNGDGTAYKTLPAVFRTMHPYNFNERATSNFRVIDLELERVVPEALDTRYVALSYVWGQLPMFRLLKSNFEQLSREGGLAGVLGALPRTILDAMQFVKSLGIRFLWVDALCLIQDDENDVEIGMEVMNSVYQGSYFTIIAASGNDATSGLPGVRPASRVASQTTVDLDPSGNGLKLTLQHSIDWHLKRSVYSQRGWTLQELVLPRRTVIFINKQVYFRCQEANWAEETTADAFTHHLDPDDGNISRIPGPLDGRLQSWWAYQKLLEEYSSREIRFDGDTLRATAGVLRPLCAGMETRMLEGLPGHYLDNALLFISGRGDLRRRPGFASFSWAGWSGSVMWPRENYVWYDNAGRRTWDTSNLFRWFASETFINWSYISVHGHQSQLMGDHYDAPCRLGLLTESITQKYPHLAERMGGLPSSGLAAYPSKYCNGSGSGPFYENWRLDQGKKDLSHAALDLANSQAEFNRLTGNITNRMEIMFLFNWTASRRGQVRRWREGTESKDDSEAPPRSIGRFHDRVHYRFRRDDEQARPREDAREENARRSIARKDCPDMFIPNFPPYAVLYFQTVSISLILGQLPDASGKMPRPGGTNKSSFHRIPGIPLFSPTSEMVGSLHADNLQLLPAPGASVECILMSHCQEPTWNSALVLREETVLTSDSEETGSVRDDHPWDLFWALYIVWKDGIAERQGVAQILSASVGKSCAPGPEVKEILLG
ncbi:HET-domain-containing protein [Coniochaeta ligniaria NRRL 30616]|uniref:HET-domain-containing protein n=1 Tax=Coniochaeta ligniaria NRRL 30616 TaxID=1408157 RepID=A0A1J7JKB0_9PEZI|nr:HET-domain-containing protein [Coniochaeta ligniaria NRRL 30616]